MNAVRAPATVIGLDAVRVRFAAISLRISPLGAEIRAFGRWFEDGVTPDRLETVSIRMGEDGPTVPVDSGHQPLGRWKRLWRFLHGIDVREIELDPRLESNQIVDVLTLLYAERRSLCGQRTRRAIYPPTLLRSVEGVAFACTVVRLEADRLAVSYSYCMTRFSRLVKWFKQRQTHLRDHRALFRAAPRYAVLVGMGPLVVFLLYIVHDSWLLLLVTSLLGSVFMFGVTYLFFMTVGSVEYDNEEKSFTLQQAYSQLKLYADRIRSDMDRARTLQQRLLPDLDAMPLADHLEWAASFVPQEEVGGDYFDASLMTQGRVAVLFSDVSGHGLGAALVTAIIKTTFEAWLEGEGELVGFVRLLNQRLFNLTPSQSFAAVAVGIYDADQRSFSYCNCGHKPHPYLIRAANGDPRPLDAAQVIILGVVPEIDPRPATLHLQGGDTLFFATDGITEARNDEEEEFETERLERYLADHRETPLQQLVTGLVDTVDSFTGGRDQEDDRTILAIRVLDAG
ncbi:MAG: PP2C family protein-serine/threonine phosphatase [Acidobacteria bacterium]|nr:PP2C family protein-serine/threonine phosphatase [Acidobacteriota bacterium]